MSLIEAGHPYTVHETYTGSGCAICGKAHTITEQRNDETFVEWILRYLRERKQK